MSHSYDWHFPLPRTHTGMLLGNGVFGAMIWGEGGVLRVTLGRADLWDHRGGIRWHAAMSYANIRAALEAGDERRLWELFSAPANAEGEPKYPSILPIGRFELDFGPDAVLTKGTLHLDDGVAEVKLTVHGRSHTVRLAMDMDAPVLGIACPKELAMPVPRGVPAWEYVGEYLASIAFSAPH
ncbi:MAG TPA: hypothetical protein PLZ36_05300, partial [Armatimonadota bacterium]|nr:hypothetical protein [Armatimonadota bacterium]